MCTPSTATLTRNAAIEHTDDDHCPCATCTIDELDSRPDQRRPNHYIPFTRGTRQHVEKRRSMKARKVYFA